MPSATMSMDAEMTASAAPTERATPRARATEGAESAWLSAARAAAPWPVWAAIFAVGLPRDGGWAMVHGPLAIAVVLAAMVVWSHRPPLRTALRWVPTIVGTGLMGELLANALTDMGRAGGLGGLTDPARAIATWTIAVGIYEVAPILAASSRITRTERRAWPLDLVAHTLFAVGAALAYTSRPVHGELWMMSPWLAAAVALPLAAARCGPARTVALPEPATRGAALWGLAAIAWGLAIAMGLGAQDGIRATLWEMRWGVAPARGALLAAPAASIALGLGAAAWLIAQALRARRGIVGQVTQRGDRSVTLEVEGAPEPMVVALDRGALPDAGEVVTLVGARPDRRDHGPYRDGAPGWRARRAWRGRPSALAGGLGQRAGGWAAWAGLAAIGLLMLLW